VSVELVAQFASRALGALGPGAEELDLQFEGRLLRRCVLLPRASGE
jgi:hypothetical protein